jgi:hypothetical protein
MVRGCIGLVAEGAAVMMVVVGVSGVRVLTATFGVFVASSSIF